MWSLSLQNVMQLHVLADPIPLSLIDRYDTDKKRIPEKYINTKGKKKERKISFI